LTHEPFVIFPLLCPAEEGSDRAALAGTWHPAMVNPPQPLILERQSAVNFQKAFLYASYRKTGPALQKRMRSITVSRTSSTTASAIPPASFLSHSQAMG